VDREELPELLDEPELVEVQLDVLPAPPAEGEELVPELPKLLVGVLPDKANWFLSNSRAVNSSRVITPS
jgi:hypothetical protein